MIIPLDLMQSQTKSQTQTNSPIPLCWTNGCAEYCCTFTCSTICPCFVFASQHSRLHKLSAGKHISRSELLTKCCFSFLCLPFCIPSHYYAVNRIKFMRSLNVHSYNGWCDDGYYGSHFITPFCYPCMLTQEKRLMDVRMGREVNCCDCDCLTVDQHSDTDIWLLLCLSTGSYNGPYGDGCDCDGCECDD
jgi:hypothetical protein